MSIIIRNISQHPTSAGPHEYELRINQQVICHFSHNREAGLAKCLAVAADAAELARMKHVIQLLEAINGERP